MIFNKILDAGGAYSPGQLFRLYIMLFTFYFLTKRNLLVIGISMSSLLLIEIISSLIHQNISGLTVGIIYSQKIIYILLVFFALNTIITKVGIVEIIRYFRNSAFLYALILFLSILLGISKSTYAEGTFGTKGLFASGNGLSIFLGVSSLIAYYYYQRFSTRINYLMFLVILVSSVIVGTKASIVFLLIVLFILYYYATNISKLLLLSIIPFTFIYFYHEISSVFSSVFDVIVLRYENSDSLFSFLSSNRDNYIAGALDNFKIEGWYILRIIFGTGVYLSFRSYADHFLIYDTLENDFFDIFFSYGIVGLLLYISLFVIGSIKLFQDFNLVLFMGWITIFTYSFIAGHVVFNGMSSMGLVLLYLVILYNRNDAKEKASTSHIPDKQP